MKYTTWILVLGLLLNAFFVYTFTNYDMASIGFVVAQPYEPQVQEVFIKENGFSPAVITIIQGDNVTWTNNHPNAIVLFSNHANARFTSRVISTGEKYSFKYSQAGTYSYVDVNFGYKGTVIVNPNQQAQPTVGQVTDSQTGQQANQEQAACQIQCVPGCTIMQDTCSCSCPCYTDADCDDTNPYTSDQCNINPVECRHVKTTEPEKNEPVREENQPKKDNKALFVVGLVIIVALGFAAHLFLVKKQKLPMNNQKHSRKK